MKKIGIVVFGVFLLVSNALPGWAAVVTLKEWAYYLDGVIYDPFDSDFMPVTGNLTDGLGTLTWATSAAGYHKFIAFYDFDIDEEINGFSNETAISYGTVFRGQSWEIDEPGYAFGDVYDNTLAGSLDNTNTLLGMKDDVAMALGWDFILDEGQIALITLLITDQTPEFGFYLRQHDPDSNSSIYISSTLDIAAPVPEPCSALLLSAGLLVLAGVRRYQLLSSQ